MQLTASLKLLLTPADTQACAALREEYAKGCNLIVPVVVEHRCWNRLDLHNRAYTRIRAETELGAQMTCNVIHSVSKAYKALKARDGLPKKQPVPVISFKHGSVHFDKRTYTLREDELTLYTLNGRIKVRFVAGGHQQALLAAGEPTEAELLERNGEWFFNLVLKSADPSVPAEGTVVGVDVGENNLAATSLGKVHGGERLRDERDRYLAHRRRLQSNGSQSAKKRLRQVSGRERRRVRHVNHEVSKQIVAEAKASGSNLIVLEDLTDIRKRIKAGKRVRARLHRWAFRELQMFVSYKARGAGIAVMFVNPAYTSQTCSVCGAKGVRNKHRFNCKKCGLLTHADCNASRNLARIGAVIAAPRAPVNGPTVGAGAA